MWQAQKREREEKNERDKGEGLPAGTWQSRLVCHLHWQTGRFKVCAKSKEKLRTGKFRPGIVVIFSTNQSFFAKINILECLKVI